MPPSTSPSARTTVKREPDRASYDPATIIEVLSGGLVAHVGIITADGSPVVIPMAFAVDGASLLLHGSVASRLMRTGSEVCVTVTIVDGWVFARSLFNSSMNYRSVAVLGVPTVLSGDEKLDALLRLSASLFPGRIDHARGPTDIELRQTTVWRLPLDEASAKIRTGPPVDDEEDLDLPYWGGVVPLRTVAGNPISDGAGQPIEVPDHVTAMVAARQ